MTKVLADVGKLCRGLSLGLTASFALIFLTLELAAPVLAEDEKNSDPARWNFSVSATPELRIYTGKPLFRHSQNRQDRSTLQPSVSVEPQLIYNVPTGEDSLVFTGFARIDPSDNERMHGDIREAYWLHEGDGWDFVFGINQVFWGVTESRHLVDIVNQTDLVEDIVGEEKLGQPMVNVNFFGDWGELNLFALPLFRPRTHPDEEGRLRGPLPIDDDRRNIEGSGGEARVDFAARFEKAVGPVDIGLSHFYGVSRAPIIDVAYNTADPTELPGVNALLATAAGRMALIATCMPTCAAGGLTGQFVLAERYDMINQSSIDLLGTYDNWMFKFEGAVINGHADDTVFAAVGGVEYSFFDVASTGGDLGLFAEFSFDDRDDGRAPQIIHDNDVFLGGRFDLNDVNNLQVKGGALIDVENGETMLTFEGSRRLAKHVTAGVEGRFFVNADNSSILRTISYDDYLALHLSFFY